MKICRLARLCEELNKGDVVFVTRFAKDTVKAGLVVRVYDGTVSMIDVVAKDVYEFRFEQCEVFIRKAIDGNPRDVKYQIYGDIWGETFAKEWDRRSVEPSPKGYIVPEYFHMPNIPSVGEE